MGGFATDVGGAPRLPEILGKPEAEYYRLYSGPPKPPPEGHVFFERTPYSRMLKITTHGGDSYRMMYGPQTDAHLVREFGFPGEKVESIMSYVWSFYKMYVKVNEVQAVPNP